MTPKRRTRRSFVTAVVVAAAAMASVAGAAESTDLQLTDAGTGFFPDRAWVLTLPSSRTLQPGDVTVNESGRPVKNLTVVPANSEGGIGTVLLIDASNSMTGKIDEAMAAARTFAEGTRGQAIAIVTFNRRPTVTLPFTFEQDRITQALRGQPRLAEGTRLYDALAAAQAQIRDARLGAGRIVLISDGDDVGSTTSRDAIVSALSNERVRVFSVGINSSDFTPDELDGLSKSTGGEFVLADQPAALRGILARFGNQASKEYVVRYSSDARPGQDVTVSVAVKGITQTTSATYTSPAAGTSAPYKKPVFSRIITGWPLMLTIVTLILGLLAYAVMRLLQLRTNRSLRRRLRDYVDLEEEAARRRREIQAIAAAMETPSSRLQQTGLFKRFAAEAEIAGVSQSPQRLAVLSVVIGLALGVLMAALFSPILFLAAALPPFLVWAEVGRRAARKRRQFQEQLDDNLEVLGAGLRAGHSLAGAMNLMADDSAEPSRTEFRRVVTDERLGVPLDAALEVTAARMRNTDLDQVALLALIQREAGGNMAEVLDQIIVNIRAREEVRRLVRVLTAQGRMARWVITGVPIGLFLAILSLNPGQLDPLFDTIFGQLMFVFAIIGIILGSYFIKKIVDIQL